MLGGRRCAFQSDFFFRGPNKRDVAAGKIRSKGIHGFDQRGAADAIIEAAGVGAFAQQRAVFFGNGDPISGFDP